MHPSSTPRKHQKALQFSEETSETEKVLDVKQFDKIMVSTLLQKLS